MASGMNVIMNQVMSAPTATAVGFAAGFVLCFLWRKLSNRGNQFGGGL